MRIASLILAGACLLAPAAASAGTPPVIGSFYASPTTLIGGESTTLAWSVAGANFLTLTPSVGTVTGTSVTMTPSVTTIYTLTASNSAGSQSATATVVVLPLPTISSFVAFPSNLAAGQSTTLSWTVAGATILVVNPNVGVVAGTSVKVSPWVTTTYTLLAGNANGWRTATVTVTVGSPPLISSFWASPSTVNSRQPTTLSWTVTGANFMTLTPSVGAVTGSSVVMNPAVTTTYTLTATNIFGSRTATVVVTVAPQSLLAILSFTATPAKLIGDQTGTLNWVVTAATSLSITPGIGPVYGTSVAVSPSATTTYTLTAANPYGSRTATVTVLVGTLPAIDSFTASPPSVSQGQSSILGWAVTGATGLSISPSGGMATGAGYQVTPSATTTYTLTATNLFGSQAATATVTVGNLPVISSFTASPSSLTGAQSSTLSWAVTGATSLSIGPGVGLVTGTSVKVAPALTTTYTLTATNGSGSTTATLTVAAGGPPVITSFWTNPNQAAGPGIGVLLTWSTLGATSLSIDHGVGPVTGTAVGVSPTSTTTYTLTATNPAGTATATVTVACIPLVTVSGQLFYSEHVLFIVPPPGQVNWVGTDSWGSLYSTANVAGYVATLKSLFPSDYFFVVVTANNLTPNNVPSVLLYRYVAGGIGEFSNWGAGVPNICRYNLGGGAVMANAFGGLGREIGHNWGVYIGAQVGDPDWLSNSTATGQMADVYSDDGYLTVKQIAGDPVNGFTWTSIDALLKNETDTFTLYDLYLQGLNSTFPDLYVLASPVYNPDHSVSYSSVAKYDQAWVEANNGVRNPTFRSSDKQFRVGFVYVARDVAEVFAVYQSIERSASQFANAEQIDTTNFRFQVPFLVDTQYRASIDALLADLDGNATPTLSITGATDVVSTDGTATIPFTAADSGSPAPVVSCVPASANCSISGGNVVLTGLAPGTWFFTIKAQNAGGKKAFAHFVVEVQ
jgi:hypothetical protein